MGQKKAGNVANGHRAGSPVLRARRARNRARLPEKKLRHVWRRNGPNAAKGYAMAHGLQALLPRVIAEARTLVEV